MPGIPQDAKPVFKGILCEVYQWEQRLFDGSTTTFEVIKRIPSVQIIATTPEKKIVLLREEQPYLGAFTSVPGGRVERHKTPDEAARMELLEELGMQPRELVLWRHECLSSTIHWESYDYVAKGCTRVQEPQQEPGEKITPYLVSFEEFLEEIEARSFRNKRLADCVFRLRHTPGELEKFRRLVLD